MDHAKNRADGGAFLSHMNEGESPHQILKDLKANIQKRNCKVEVDKK